MIRFRKRRGSETLAVGLSPMEMVVAMFMIGIFFFMGAQVFRGVALSLISNQIRVNATRIAEDGIQWSKNVPYERLFVTTAPVAVAGPARHDGRTEGSLVVRRQPDNDRQIGLSKAGHVRRGIRQDDFGFHLPTHCALGPDSQPYRLWRKWFYPAGILRAAFSALYHLRPTMSSLRIRIDGRPEQISLFRRSRSCGLDRTVVLAQLAHHLSFAFPNGLSGACAVSMFLALRQGTYGHNEKRFSTEQRAFRTLNCTT